MSGVALVLHQFRYDQKVFWRNAGGRLLHGHAAADLPLIFATIFGNDTIEELGTSRPSTYYVPAIITLAVVSATMQSLAIRLTDERESGSSSACRGTPLPTWVFFAGRFGNAIVISLVMLVLVTRDRPPLLRRPDPDRDDPGDAGDADRRRLPLLLASASR